MEDEIQEIHTRKIKPSILAISIAHLMITLFLIVNLFLEIAEFSSFSRLAPFVMYLVFKVLLILLNLTAGIFLIKYRSIGWWSSIIYFSSILPTKIVVALGALYVQIQLISFGDNQFFLTRNLDLKVAIYEIIFSFIIVIYLLNNRNLTQFKITLAKRNCIFILVGLSILLTLYQIVLSFL